MNKGDTMTDERENELMERLHELERRLTELEDTVRRQKEELLGEYMKALAL
jgi:sugar-specific transcriptional regulator TrmB